jgi:O-antigen/teichoic acid export membrane protein
MQRQFIQNLLLLIFLNLLIKPFWIFGIDRSVQNALGSESYGLYFALFNLSILFNIFNDIGINNYNNRLVSSNPEEYYQRFKKFSYVKFLLGLLYFFILVVSGVIFQYRKYEIFLLAWLGINQVLSSFLLFIRSNISGLHWFKFDALISVLDRTLMIGVCSVLLWGKESMISVESYIGAQTFSYVITIIVAFGGLVYRFPFRKSIKENIRFSEIKEIIKKTLPYALLILLMSIYNRVDSVMLERMLPEGKKISGIYAQSFRILDALAMFSYLFSTLLLPIFSKMIARKENVGGLARLSTRWILAVPLILSMGALFYGDYMISLLYKENVTYSSKVFKVLIFGTVPISLSYIFGTLLTAGGYMKVLNRTAAAGMGMNVLLNFILIPLYGAIGAAAASVFTQLITSLIQWRLASKYYQIHYSFKFWKKLLVFASGILYCAWFSHDLSKEVEAGLVLFFASSLFFTLAIRFIDFRQIIKSFQVK